MTTLWILVANSAYAHIYEVKGQGKDIKKIHHIDHPDARKKGEEILSDRPGRSFDSTGIRRSAVSPQVDLKMHMQEQFAKELAQILQQGKNEHKFDQIALVAPPQFLGELNNAISDSVKKCISKHLSKDLPEYLNDREQIEYLCKHLDLWNY
jgi:protein required for attachment to host cells